MNEAGLKEALKYDYPNTEIHLIDTAIQRSLAIFPKMPVSFITFQTKIYLEKLIESNNSRTK